jgi:hypothetical protein
MGRMTEVFALANMTSEERRRYAYGKNAESYFTHITIDTKILKQIKPPKK